MAQAKMKPIDAEKHATTSKSMDPPATPTTKKTITNMQWSWREINRVLFVAAAAGGLWFLGGATNPYITAIGVICTFVGGFPIFHEAWENIAQRRMTIELSMTIAIVAALAIRELVTALVITLFVLVAEVLEELTVGRGPAEPSNA
jgi:cation transport ATPase